MHKNSLSIIVPVYKVEKYLKRCLESIRTQSFTDWECILIDDGTPDNSGKICDEYATMDNRFKVFHQSNSGVSNARNKGIELSTGNWISFVDSDDWLETDTYETVIQSCNEDDYDILQWGYYCSNDKCDTRLYSFSSDFSLIDYEDNEPYFSFQTMLFKSEFLKKNNIKFLNNLSMGEDWIFCLTCYLKTSRIKNLKNTLLYHYYQNNNSVSRKPTLNNIYSQIDFINTFDSMLSHTPYKESLKRKVIIHKTGAKMNLLKTYHFKLYKKTFPEIEPFLLIEKSRFTAVIHLLHYHLDFLAYIYLFIRYRLSDVKQLIIKIYNQK